MNRSHVDFATNQQSNAQGVNRDHNAGNNEPGGDRKVCLEKVSKRKREQIFPVQLHYMLGEAKVDKVDHLISWQPHGRCFVVHDQKEFTKQLLPLWFRQTKFSSFQRQLNLYGFKRISAGPDKGGYYHRYFVRGRRYLCYEIQRYRVKGTLTRKPSSPENEPNFYAPPYSPCFDIDDIAEGRSQPRLAGSRFPNNTNQGCLHQHDTRPSTDANFHPDGHGQRALACNTNQSSLYQHRTRTSTYANFSPDGHGQRVLQLGQAVQSNSGALAPPASRFPLINGAAASSGDIPAQQSHRLQQPPSTSGNPALSASMTSLTPSAVSSPSNLLVARYIQDRQRRVAEEIAAVALHQQLLQLRYNALQESMRTATSALTNTNGGLQGNARNSQILNPDERVMWLLLGRSMNR